MGMVLHPGIPCKPFPPSILYMELSTHLGFSWFFWCMMKFLEMGDTNTKDWLGYKLSTWCLHGRWPHNILNPRRLVRGTLPRPWRTPCLEPELNSWHGAVSSVLRGFVHMLKKSPLDPKGWFTHIFRSSKSPPNLWVFHFLAFFLVVIRSRSFPQGAVESTDTSNTSSCRAFGTWFRTASLCVRLWKTYESSKGTRLPSSVIAHTFKYKDAPSEEDISYSTTQCINSSLGQS